MKRKIKLLALVLLILLTKSTQAQNGVKSDAKKKDGALIITLTGLDVSDKTIELKYKIKNGSDHDVWICDCVDVHSGFQFQVYLSEGDKTLFIHRRHEVLPDYDYEIRPYGRYIRLREGEDHAESISLSVPVIAKRVYEAGRRLQGKQLARRVVIEIGYYLGDMPRMIREILTEAERLSDTKLNHNLEVMNKNYFRGLVMRGSFGGLLHFNELNEGLRSRDEELLIPYSFQAFKGEKVLRIEINGLLIPCEEEEKTWTQQKPNFVTFWSRVEIQYQPSMLEYFFPYAGQQSLLDSTEKEHLQSMKTIVIENREQLRALASEISKGVQGGIVAERSKAHVVCYRDGKRLTSFNVYNNTSIETEEKRKRWFWYRSGLQSLKTLIPQINPFEFRVRCAANLKDLWHRLSLYHKAEDNRLKDSSKMSEMVYPVPTTWCDSMVLAYGSIGMLDKFLMKPHMCPGADKGKSHYAMNPNCKPDSPPDMVLLFETKAGWNQHGGPELFTFDNHEPKGGCVLLNDGTVKFIRTKKELHHLRWK